MLSSLSTAKSPKKRNGLTVIRVPPGHTNSSSTEYTENYFHPAIPPASLDESQPESAESFTSTIPYANMLLVRPGYQSTTIDAPPAFASMQPSSPTLETITYQHIQETSSKRISTLDYLRKASVISLLFRSYFSCI